MDPPEPRPDDELGPQIIAQVFDLWVQPELTRRGADLNREAVHKVLVEMRPGLAPRVLINDETKLIAHVRATRSIAEGEEIGLADFDQVAGLTPADIDVDAGWICFARIGDQEVVAFDFRYNRGRAHRRLERAREFLASAQDAATAARRAVAVENAFAAAELAVQALMSLHDNSTRDHQARRQWFAAWTKLGNAPEVHSRALADLAKRRAAARYGEGSVRMRPQHLSTVLKTVADIIEFAEAKLSDIDARGLSSADARPTAVAAT